MYSNVLIKLKPTNEHFYGTFLSFIPVYPIFWFFIIILSGDPAPSRSDNRKINRGWRQEMVEQGVHIKSATPFFSFIVLTFCLFEVFSSKSKSRIMFRFKYSSPKPEY